jgi:hypothetical protein
MKFLPEAHAEQKLRDLLQTAVFDQVPDMDIDRINDITMQGSKMQISYLPSTTNNLDAARTIEFSLTLVSNAVLIIDDEEDARDIF